MYDVDFLILLRYYGRYLNSPATVLLPTLDPPDQLFIWIVVDTANCLLFFDPYYYTARRAGSKKLMLCILQGAKPVGL